MLPCRPAPKSQTRSRGLEAQFLLRDPVNNVYSFSISFSGYRRTDFYLPIIASLGASDSSDSEHSTITNSLALIGANGFFVVSVYARRVLLFPLLNHCPSQLSHCTPIAFRRLSLIHCNVSYRNSFPARSFRLPPDCLLVITTDFLCSFPNTSGPSECSNTP